MNFCLSSLRKYIWKLFHKLSSSRSYTAFPAFIAMAALLHCLFFLLLIDAHGFEQKVGTGVLVSREVHMNTVNHISKTQNNIKHLLVEKNPGEKILQSWQNNDADKNVKIPSYRNYSKWFVLPNERNKLSNTVMKMEPRRVLPPGLRVKNPYIGVKVPIPEEQSNNRNLLQFKKIAKVPLAQVGRLKHVFPYNSRSKFQGISKHVGSRHLSAMVARQPMLKLSTFNKNMKEVSVEGFDHLQLINSENKFRSYEQNQDGSNSLSTLSVEKNRVPEPEEDLLADQLIIAKPIKK